LISSHTRALGNDNLPSLCDYLGTGKSLPTDYMKLCLHLLHYSLVSVMLTTLSTALVSARSLRRKGILPTKLRSVLRNNVY